MRFTEVKLPIRPGDRHWVPAPGKEPLSLVDLRCGDSMELLRTLPAESVDACVTDPPYGIRFMGKAWDGRDIEAKTKARRECAQNPNGKAGPNGEHNSRAAEAGKYDRSYTAELAFALWTEEWAREMFRVLKPGAHLVSFASTRTYHRMVCGIEDAGFEIRDQLAWVFGSGFPKSSNQSGDWEGWGTALKPGWEPIVLARKPMIGTVPANLAAHGVGAIHIEACRIFTEGNEGNEGEDEARGRWPANLLHDGSDEVVALFPEAGGQQGDLTGQSEGRKSRGIFGDMPVARDFLARIEEDTSAARFFYCAKASRADRNDGLSGRAKKALNWSSGSQSPGTFQAEGTQREVENHHPTVKPTALMRWLCRLVTPAGGLIVDPFIGSGSTARAAVLEGFGIIGFDQDAEYLEIARARTAASRKLRAEELAEATRQPELFTATPGMEERP